MENEEQMLKRHKREIDYLQENCKHEKISDWQPYYWAPGHTMGDCRVCEICGKIMEKTWPDTAESVFSSPEPPIVAR